MDAKSNNRLAFNAYDQKKSNSIKSLMLGNNLATPTEQITIIDLALVDPLDSFEHPFEKSVNHGIEELAEKIKVSGLLEPITVRSKVGGRYEILAGHRRTAASRIAGKTDIKAIVKNVDDDEAKIIVTDTNLGQRDEILPSERAKAYKIQIEALKNQGKRNDLILRIDNFVHPVHEVEENEKTSAAKIGRESGQSARMVNYYLKLNGLIPGLLDMVDEKEISVKVGAKVADLKTSEQMSLYELLKGKDGMKITIEIADVLQEHSKEVTLTKAIIEAILNPVPNGRKNHEIEPSKTLYKIAIKNAEKYIKKLGEEQEKLDRVDANELENRIKEVIAKYFDSL